MMCCIWFVVQSFMLCLSYVLLPLPNKWYQSRWAELAEIWCGRMIFEFVAGALFFSLTLSAPIGRNVDLGICREHLGDLSVVCWKWGDIHWSLPCVEGMIAAITCGAIPVEWSPWKNVEHKLHAQSSREVWKWPFWFDMHESGYAYNMRNIKWFGSCC
jgi:hypothetical protein